MSDWTPQKQTQPRKTKILFIYQNCYSFVENDLTLLRSAFNVILLRCKGPRGVFRFVLSLVPGIKRTDASFVWFGDYHAALAVLIAKIFHRKTVVIAGGYDAVSLPSIKYGLMGQPLGRLFAIVSFALADKVLAVSNSTRRSLQKYVGHKNVCLVHLGFDSTTFRPKGDKKNLVVTVGEVSIGNLTRKGQETFVRTARYLPNVTFVMIGAHLDESISYLKRIAGTNVEFTGFVPREKLLSYLQAAKVYVQISLYESFGCALAEAMLCGCVPVVTSRGAIPEVVGDAGFYVPPDNPKATALAIQNALASSKGHEARNRIAHVFPLETRKSELLRIMNELMSAERGYG